MFLDKIYFYFYRLKRGAKPIHPLKMFNTWLKTALQCSHKGTCLSLSWPHNIVYKKVRTDLRNKAYASC